PLGFDKASAEADNANVSDSRPGGVAGSTADGGAASPWSTGASPGGGWPPASSSPSSAGRRNSPLSTDWATSPAATCRGETWGPRHVGPRRRDPPPAALQAFQLVQHIVQAQSRDELHDVVVQAVLLADAEHRDDVGVVQPGGRPGLTLKPLLLAVVQQELVRQ